MRKNTQLRIFTIGWIKENFRLTTYGFWSCFRRWSLSSRPRCRGCSSRCCGTRSPPATCRAPLQVCRKCVKCQTRNSWEFPYRFLHLEARWSSRPRSTPWRVRESAYSTTDSSWTFPVFASSFAASPIKNRFIKYHLHIFFFPSRRKNEANTLHFRALNSWGGENDNLMHRLGIIILLFLCPLVPLNRLIMTALWIFELALGVTSPKKKLIWSVTKAKKKKSSLQTYG